MQKTKRENDQKKILTVNEAIRRDLRIDIEENMGQWLHKMSSLLCSENFIKNLVYFTKLE